MELEGHGDLMDDLYASGRYQPETTAYIRDQVQPGMVCFDVGAHVGFMTRQMLARSGRVYSFEPNRASFEMLCRNAPEATCFNFAVGREVERVFVHREPYYNSGQLECHRSVEGETLMVPLSLFHPRPDFIKVDAQGWDGEVILGMLPHRCNAVIEWWPEGIQRVTGRDPDEVLHEIRQAGYEVQHLGTPDADDWWDLHLVPIGAV